MKAASPTLLTLFASNLPFEQFDLYTVTLTSGLIVRYATCAFDVAYGGNTWLCARSIGGIVIDEGSDTSGPRAKWTNGFNTGTWSVNIMPRASDVIGNVPWTAAVRSGILDEAMVRVDRGYVSAWPSMPTLSLTPIGLVNVFLGRVAEIDFGRSVVQINMNDPRELLDAKMPRNLYSAACRYALFSPQCTLNKAAFAVNCAVTSVVSLSTFVASFPLTAEGQYNFGNLEWISGANAGLRMMVRQSGDGGTVILLAPMPFIVGVGDRLKIFPGCDKTTATCTNKFNNRINFGGFPLIPAPETSM
jgi:hypothetical protein